VLSVVFLASLLAGLLLGVRAMLVGVERPRPDGTGTRPAVSMPSIAAFATLFGLVGHLLLRYAELSPAVALGLAVVAGALGVAGAVALVARWAVSPPAEHDDHHHHGVDPRYLLQGTPAVVTRAVTADRDGEIRYVGEDGAHYATPARSFDGSALEVGVDVAIDRIEDGVAYVEAWALVEKRL
jgi:hypothetical protein